MRTPDPVRVCPDRSTFVARGDLSTYRSSEVRIDVTGKEFDMVVVGGGVAGVAAVRKLASAALSVALVEDRLVGGECHYWGCNPSKTPLRPIEVFNLAKAVPGVREVISAEGPDIAAVFAKRDAIIEHRSDRDRTVSLREAGGAVFHGFGRRSGERRVRVSYEEL